jgi:ankyrin repeat protein
MYDKKMLDINIDNVKKDDILKNKISVLLENGKWLKIKKILLENDDFDCNFKNNKNIYFLDYLVLFNQYDIIKLIIHKIKIDIVNENQQTILYVIIKYGYTNLLKIILEKNNSMFGKDILEIFDIYGNNPLFYCVLFNSLDCLKILLQYFNNLNFKNKNGFNALHYCIINSNLEMFKILSTKININSKTNNGETPLILSLKHQDKEFLNYLLLNNVELNLIENKYNFTALHYVAYLDDLSIYNIIEPYISKFDGNIQDKSGNIFFHYFINSLSKKNNSSDVLKIFNIIKKNKFDYNIKNIDGNISAHLFLENIINIEEFDEILKDIIINSNLNIQNNNGDSCLFLLVKKKVWKKYLEILKNKKLNVFILNSKRENIFKFIDIEDLELFIEMLTKSYMNLLINNKDLKIKYIFEVDNNCVNLKDYNKCFILIKERIKNDITEFTKKNIIKNTMSSYPKKTLYPNIIENYKNISFSSYTSTSINLFSGLYYLSKKFKNVRTPLNLINKETKIINCNNNYCDFINYSLQWKNYKLINDFENLDNYIKSIKSKKLFFIIPLNIILFDNYHFKGHSNYIIFDFEKKTVERFEPYGANTPNSLNYDFNLLDNKLENYVLTIDSNFIYISPKKYLSKFSFQYKEIYELNNNYIGDPDGFCSAWSLFWTEIRIKFTNINLYKLELLIFIEMINKNIGFRKLIRNYSNNITILRDMFLKKIKTNINEWENDNVPFEKVLKLEKIIKTLIINEII